MNVNLNYCECHYFAGYLLAWWDKQPTLPWDWAYFLHWWTCAPSKSCNSNTYMVTNLLNRDGQPPRFIVKAGLGNEWSWVVYFCLTWVTFSNRVWCNCIVHCHTNWALLDKNDVGWKATCGPKKRLQACIWCLIQDRQGGRSAYIMDG